VKGRLPLALFLRKILFPPLLLARLKTTGDGLKGEKTFSPCPPTGFDLLNTHLILARRRVRKCAVRGCKRDKKAQKKITMTWHLSLTVLVLAMVNPEGGLPSIPLHFFSFSSGRPPARPPCSIIPRSIAATSPSGATWTSETKGAPSAPLNSTRQMKIEYFAFNRVLDSLFPFALQVCEAKTETVCQDVPMTRCELIAYTDCT